MSLRKARLLVCLLVGLSLAVAADGWAQQHPRGPSGGGPMGPGMHRRGPGPEGPPMRTLLLRVAKLPAEAQQQALESDEAFQRMPPRMQERVRQRLAEFNALPAEQRQTLLEQFERGGEARPLHALFLRVAPLSPEEQQRALQEDTFFQALPPQAQERFRRHLERFSQQPPEERQRQLGRFQRFADLPPEEQERLRYRAERFAEMNPEQRREARRVFHAWQQLPPERRDLMVERLRRLQSAAPEERRSLLEDEDFLAPLSAEEKQLLQQVWRLRQVVPPPGPQGPSPPY